MRWKQGRRSENVIDNRGRRPSRGAMLGGGGILGILLMLAALYFGVDPAVVQQFMGGGGQQQPQQEGPVQRPEAENELADFVSVVLGYTEDVWAEELMAQKGMKYRPPKLHLFTTDVKSGCGFQSAQVGPFYCPADQTVYIDLQFFQDLQDKFGAAGDFAQAYVIAHEVGHHLQNLLGTSGEVHRAQQRMSKEDANRLSVMLELQADAYAGVWAHHAHKDFNILERGDIEEALRAAQAIGDDTLQKRARGRVQPESFTHGTSEQRARWFRRGLESGSMEEADTFNAQRL